GRQERRSPSDRRRHRPPTGPADVRRHPRPGPRDPPGPRAAFGGTLGRGGLARPVRLRLVLTADRPAMPTTPVPAGAPGRVAVGVSGVRPGRTGWLVIVGVATIVVAFVAGIALGSVDLAPSTTLGILLHRIGFGVPVTWPPSAEAIVVD